MCNDAASKLESGKKYHRSEAQWLFDLYDLKGEYIIVSY
jgi:hypothetical protein